MLIAFMNLCWLPIPTYATEESIPQEHNAEPVIAQEPTEVLMAVPEESIPEPISAESEEMIILKNDVPLYLQTDYPNHMYGSGTIATSGCGITCLAMVATYLTGHAYSPVELADYFGGRAENNIARLEYAAEALQLPFRKAENWHDTLRELEEGKVVIALMNETSIFTSSQHFIVLTGMTEEGKILVNDPYGPNYDYWLLKNGFENGFKQGDILCGYGGAWIFDKSAMPEEPFFYTEERTYVEPRYHGIELTWEEIQLLAKVVWVEAQGECPEGQQAVAEVVLNRMVSENYSDTLSSVIYAEGQFRSVPYLEDATPWQSQYEAIERALFGPYVLPMDVVHFATYAVNENVWGQIGGHIFCYQS